MCFRCDSVWARQFHSTVPQSTADGIIVWHAESVIFLRLHGLVEFILLKVIIHLMKVFWFMWSFHSGIGWIMREDVSVLDMALTVSHNWGWLNSSFDFSDSNRQIICRRYCSWLYYNGIRRISFIIICFNSHSSCWIYTNISGTTLIFSLDLFLGHRVAVVAFLYWSRN